MWDKIRWNLLMLEEQVPTECKIQITFKLLAIILTRNFRLIQFLVMKKAEAAIFIRICMKAT